MQQEFGYAFFFLIRGLLFNLWVLPKYDPCIPFSLQEPPTLILIDLVLLFSHNS